MNKLLKQLVQVLDEEGIQVSRLNVGNSTIKINEEITIIDRGNIYGLYAEDGSLDTNYESLTKTLDVAARYLSRLKVGDTLVSKYGTIEVKVVAYEDNNLYNLFDVKRGSLFYSEGKSLEDIHKTHVKHGVLHVK